MNNDFRQKLLEMLDDDVVDTKHIARAAIVWLNQEQVRSFVQFCPDMAGMEEAMFGEEDEGKRSDAFLAVLAQEEMTD